MSQYDLLIIQNVGSGSTDFAEKYVNLGKGGLISVNSSNVPTVLAAGTNGYYLQRDDAEATGLKWVALTSPSHDHGPITFSGLFANNGQLNFGSTSSQTAYLFNDATLSGSSKSVFICSGGVSNSGYTVTLGSVNQVGSLYVNGSTTITSELTINNLFIAEGRVGDERALYNNDDTEIIAGYSSFAGDYYYFNGALAGNPSLIITQAKFQFNYPSTSAASVRLPHGTAPTAPFNGDMWTTTSGLYVRINGATIGPLGLGGSSQWVTSGSNIYYMEGNLGIGTSDIEAWHSCLRVLESTGSAIVLNHSGGSTQLVSNAYYNATGWWFYKETGVAASYAQIGGEHYFRVATSGTIDTALTWKNAMRIDQSGMVFVYGLSSNTLNVNGNTLIKGVLQAYRYLSASNLPAITLDKPGSYSYGIGPDGTNMRVRYGTALLDGSTWNLTGANGIEHYFDGNVVSTNRIDANSNSGSGGFISSGNYQGTGTAAWFPSGIYSAGTNWLYGTCNFNGTLQDSDQATWYITDAGNSKFLNTISPVFNMNRSNWTASGFLYYSSSYTAWQTYMAAGSATNQGASGTITAPSGTNVTSWALRSFIENASGYGWTWEVGTSTSTTPAIVAELSKDGVLRVATSVYANGVLLGSTTYPLTLSGSQNVPFTLIQSSSSPNMYWRFVFAPTTSMRMDLSNDNFSTYSSPIIGDIGGAVSLQYGLAVKLATTTTGVSITGNALVATSSTTSTDFVAQFKHGATSGTTIRLILAKDGNNNDRGYINMNISTSTLTFVSSSDERLKTNIALSSMNALDIINNIPVKDFNFKERPNEALITGFIAQDVNKYFPQAVSRDEQNDTWDLAWGYSMNPLYHKAIQQLTDRIKELETKIKELTS